MDMASAYERKDVEFLPVVDVHGFKTRGLSPEFEIIGIRPDNAR